MIIHSLRVTNFCGISNREIHPRTKGITIIEGPNEAGKSCFARALYMLLDKLDSTAEKSVQACRPVDKDVGPEIEADIEIGPYRFKLFKRFVKDKSTLLTITSPTKETLTGRDAHNRVQEMIKKANMDISLWKALNIIQGAAPENIPTNSSLSMALSSAAGTVPVGAKELGILDLVKAEKDKYYTASWKPAGDLKEKSEITSSIEEQTGAIREQLKLAESDNEACSNFENQLHDLRQDRVELVFESERRKGELERGRDLSRDLELLASNLRGAVLEHQQILDDVESRDKLKKAINKALEGQESLAEGGDLNEELLVAERSLDEAKTRYRAKESFVEGLRKLKDLRQKDIDYLDRVSNVAQLKERHQKVTASKMKAAGAQFVLDNNTVSDEVLAEIKDAKSKVDHAKTNLDMDLPNIKLEATDNIDIYLDKNRIRLNKGEIERKVISEELVIDVPNSLSITVITGRSQVKIMEKFQKAKDSYDKLLETHRIKDLKEAMSSNLKLQEAIKLLEDYDRVKKSDLAKTNLDDLTDLINGTEEQIGAYLHSRVNDPPLFETKREAVTALEGLERSLITAEDELKDEDAKRSKAETLRDKMRKESGEALEKQNRLQWEIDSKTELLLTAQEKMSDRELEEKRKTAESEKSHYGEELHRKRSENQHFDLPTIELLSKNADSALASLEERIGETKDLLNKSKNKLEMLVDEGLSEKLSMSESQLIQAERELAAVVRQAEAARLLFLTMEAEKLEAQQKYMNPLKERIERLGSVLFNPTFEISLDEGLNVESRTLDGKTLSFEQLSTGAKEQIGMISKLACAMIVQKEEGVPVILDDALGHTDPNRIKAMNAILMMASQECQIILMTCYPSRYTGIGDAKVENITSCI